MKKHVLYSLVAVIICAVAAPVFAANSSVKVINGSKWDIHHFFVSPAEHDQWGPDQLGDNIISTGESFTLKNIPCGSYDVKVVDEDGDECIVEAVDLCGDKAYWKLTDESLLNCEGYGDDDSE